MRHAARACTTTLCVLLVFGYSLHDDGQARAQSTDTAGTANSMLETSMVTGTASTGDTAGTSGTSGTASTTNTSGTAGTTSTGGTASTTNTTGTAGQITADQLFDKALKLVQEAKSNPGVSKIQCDWEAATCGTYNLPVNGDEISTIQLTKLPQRKAIIAVTAGESFGDPLLSANFREFNVLPPDVAVSVHVNRSLWPTYRPGRTSMFGTSKAMRETYTYPRVNRSLAEAEEAYKNARKIQDVSESATTAYNAHTLERFYLANQQEDFVSFITTGRSPLLLIRVQTLNADQRTWTMKTFAINLIYQRWFVDSGGFFAFTTARDQELVLEASGTNQQTVVQHRHKGNASTATGVSFNVHPGNYPNIGIQFGLVHNSDRQPSYFLGPTVRLRSLGQMAVMSFSAGWSQTQIRTFPGIQVGQAYPTGGPLLTGQMRYTFKPYVSVGIGINLTGSSNPAPNAPPPATTTAPVTNTTGTATTTNT